MTGIRRFSNDHPLFFGLICAVLFVLTFYVLPVFLYMMGCYDVVAHECFVAIFFSALAIKVAGPFRLSRKGIGYTLRKSTYFLIISNGTVFFFVFILLVTGTFTLEKGWVGRVLYFGLYLFSVGVFEEILLRVLITGSFVRKFGNTSRGFILAVTAGSLCFGLIHVLPDIMFGRVNDLSTVLQMLLKTADTAIVGLLLTALYYRTHNIWGCILTHMLADLQILMVLALMNQPMIESYIRTDENPGGNSMSYVIYPLIVFLFYLPILSAALRELSKIKTPEYGPFIGGWEPRDPLSDPESDVEELSEIPESLSETAMVSK